MTEKENNTQHLICLNNTPRMNRQLLGLVWFDSLRMKNENQEWIIPRWCLTKKIQLENKLKAFDKQIEERNQIEKSKREEEITYLKEQNENLEKFLQSIDQAKAL